MYRRSSRPQGRYVQLEQNMRYFARMIPISMLVLGAIGVAASPSLAARRQSVQAHANLSVQQAREIALKHFRGKIMKEELEHEPGGSGLRYSFDIVQSGKWRELG